MVFALEAAKADGGAVRIGHTSSSSRRVAMASEGRGQALPGLWADSTLGWLLAVRRVAATSTRSDAARGSHCAGRMDHAHDLLPHERRQRIEARLRALAYLLRGDPDRIPGRLVLAWLGGLLEELADDVGELGEEQDHDGG